MRDGAAAAASGDTPWPPGPVSSLRGTAEQQEVDVLADYSRTPLARKLGMRDGQVVYLLDASEGFLELLEPLPQITIRRRLSGPIDVAVAFTATQRQLARALDRLQGAITPSGGLWIAWPKRSSGVATELDFSIVQSSGGLRPRRQQVVLDNATVKLRH